MRNFNLKVPCMKNFNLKVLCMIPAGHLDTLLSEYLQSSHLYSAGNFCPHQALCSPWRFGSGNLGVMHPWRWQISLQMQGATNCII